LRHLDTHTLWVQQAVREKRVDLRKVDGEANPADVLTKHFCSRDKLAHLVSLYGCRYTTGRSEAAPQVRQGQSNRVKIGQALAQGETTAIGTMDDFHDFSDIILPHLAYGGGELDKQYPPMGVPEDPFNETAACERADAADGILQAGLRQASAIAGEAAIYGRKRHMPDRHVPQA